MSIIVERTSMYLLHEGDLSNRAPVPSMLHVITGLIVSTRNNPASQVNSHTSPSPGITVARPDAVLQENEPYSTMGMVHVGAVDI